MADEVTFGVRLPNSGPFAARDTLLAVAKAADRLGFDAIWVHDHIPWSREKRSHFAAGSIEAVRDQDPNFFESLSLLAYLGGMAPRPRLGVAGLVVPLRDPRVLAKQAATLHEMSGGRLILAIGIGAIPNDFEVMGVPYSRRGKITDEYLRAMLAIFSEAPAVTFAGPRVRFANGEFYPKPKNLPIWIAGMSEAAYRRMAWAGNGWLPVYLSPEEYRAQAEQMHRVLREAGRDPGEIAHGHEIFVTVARTDEEAVAIAARSLEHKFKTLARGLAVSAAGSPQAVRRRLAEYVEAGATHLELKYVCPTPSQMVEMMEMTAAEVLPALR